jgi:hypothetical protein
MSLDCFDAFSAAQRETARAALSAAFGAAAIGAITPMTGGAVTLSATVASAGELNFTARRAHSETVNPSSLGYWTLKALIGTAVPNAFWMAHPTVLE